MFFLIGIVLLMFPEKATMGAMEGIKVAFDTVIVSVLPFLIVSQGLVYTGGGDIIVKLFSPLFKLLGLNEKCAEPFMLSLLSGYPSGCRIIAEMYKERLITKEEAESFLAFCNNGGVVFCISVCGIRVFSDYKIGILIFMVQIIASLITGIIFKSKKGEGIKIKREKMKFLPALGKSIYQSGLVLVNILATFIIFHALINALSLDKVPLFCGVVEFTKGVFEAGRLNSVPLASMFFSFGGLSVFVQSATLLEGTDLKTGKMIIGKIITAVLAFFITKILLMVNFY